MDRQEAIFSRRSGAGQPLLVLLHGQAANGDVWAAIRDLAARDWPGGCLVPDLRGHGRSPWRPPYAYGTHAADVADLIGPDEEVFLVGHSMGGAIALMLATPWFGLKVRGVFAFGIKVHWSADELVRRRQFAAAPRRWFETRGEAVERYLKVSGQFGFVEAATPAALSGVAEENGRFRLAADPRAGGYADPPDIRPVRAAVTVPVRLAVGERDAMVPLADARALDPDASIIPGAGHNAHVECPEVVWDLILHDFRGSIA